MMQAPEQWAASGDDRVHTLPLGGNSIIGDALWMT